jgi:surface protein
MHSAFKDAKAFNQNLVGWGGNRASVLTTIFGSGPSGDTPLSNCIKGPIYLSWGTTLQGIYTAWNFWCGASCSLRCLVNNIIGTAATAWLTDPTTAATTYGPISDWETYGVSNMNSLFSGKATFNSDISKWNTVSVSNMASMFYSATMFNSDLSNWNTRRVVTMSQMFHLASEFNQGIGTWNTASVSNMYSMFHSATAFNQNIASWNVVRVTTLTSAFDSTTALSVTTQSALYQVWGATLQAAYPTWTASTTARSRSRRSRPKCCTRRAHYARIVEKTHVVLHTCASRSARAVFVQPDALAHSGAHSGTHSSSDALTHTGTDGDAEHGHTKVIVRPEVAWRLHAL